ncbi:hypothetical protein FTO70_16865 [Methanosarcina sp. KYL-1]|uniref:TolB family protein n=1 Tax=Methanosarcina sp. KYL-1 TaxID=2602068 RepID=UPI002101A484|nr:DPP IV N-terminal domain-containing protein [Methanosarcina sp. KYL-1]MCQ1537313.1 hypothetical protein [Methanosarcina sp. KYL-1]
MIMNMRLIFLLICVAFLMVVASNAASADSIAVEALTDVTSNTIDEWGPVWSPEGDKILFLRDGDLYRVFSNGSGEMPLTETGGYAGDYSWSPDGNNILYSFVIDGLNTDILVINTDGFSESRLTGSNTPVGRNDTGTWSPSGSKIAYLSGLDDQFGYIMVMNPDGSDKQIIAGPLLDNCISSLAWSPDSLKIAFESYSLDEGIYIGVLNSDGSNFTTIPYGYLTPQTQSWQSQVWSPDGSKILYYSRESGNGDLYTINADGSGKTQLTTDEADDSNPLFSPAGSRIVFVSDRAGNNDIWVMDADGNNKVQLTSDTADDRYPVWSPDGTKIAFCSNRNGNYDIWVMDLSGDVLQESPSPRVTGFTVDPSNGVPEDGTAAISITVRNDGNK